MKDYDNKEIPILQRSKSPIIIERNLDRIIRANMKGESSFSPLKYHPKYQDDEISRKILHGNRNIGNEYKNLYSNLPIYGNDYFNSIQHKYLNVQYDNSRKMWNLNEDVRNQEEENKKGNNFSSGNGFKGSEVSSPNRLAEYGKNLISNNSNNYSRAVSPRDNLGYNLEKNLYNFRR